LFLRRTEAEPALHGRGELAVAGQHHAAGGDGGANGVEPHPDRGHGPEIDRHIEIDVEARIDRAKIDAVAGIDDQPPGPLRCRQLGIGKLHHAALRRHRRGVQVPPHVPHQELDVEMLQRQMRFDAALTPDPERLDDGPSPRPAAVN
jgi:hypothetical protein